MVDVGERGEDHGRWAGDVRLDDDLDRHQPASAFGTRRNDGPVPSPSEGVP